MIILWLNELCRHLEDYISHVNLISLFRFKKPRAAEYGPIHCMQFVVKRSLGQSMQHYIVWPFFLRSVFPDAKSEMTYKFIKWLQSLLFGMKYNPLNAYTTTLSVIK